MKIQNTKNVTATKKKAKTSQSGNVSGPSFDSLVEKASSVDKAEAAQSVAPTAAPLVDVGGGSAVPEEAEKRGHYLLERLEELERDVLAGRASDAVVRLKEALETQAIDRDQLSAELLSILDEIEMRASIEVAKMEEAAGSDKE